MWRQLEIKCILWRFLEMKIQKKFIEDDHRRSRININLPGSPVYTHCDIIPCARFKAAVLQHIVFWTHPLSIFSVLTSPEVTPFAVESRKAV
jgi:hypothetical protein